MEIEQQQKEFCSRNRISCTCKLAFFLAVSETFLHPGISQHTYVSQDDENISLLPSPAMSANCFKDKHDLSKETIIDHFLKSSACFSKTYWKLFWIYSIRFYLQDIIINHIWDFRGFLLLSFCFILSFFSTIFPLDNNVLPLQVEFICGKRHKE